MKLTIYIPLFVLTFFVIAANSYSQQECCENKQASCCVEKSDCCNEHAGSMNTIHDINGNAAGDTATGIVCVVSGEAIGEGQGLKFDYYGKTYNFCCEGCLAKFKKEPFDYAKNLECPVMGDPIESKDVFIVHNGTKYYVCCPPCQKSFEKNPEKYIGSK